jgi:hypothetical protein
MPVQNTTKLGLQEESSTGKISAHLGNQLAGNGLLSFVSDAYISQQSGTMAATRLWLAATSGQYLVTWMIEVTSVAGTSSFITPNVAFYSYGFGPGGGYLNTMAGSTSYANARTATSGQFWIRSAASDIFVSTTYAAGASSAPALYNINFSIFQASS